MPKFVTPSGRADLDRISEDLVDHLRRRARGAANIVGANALADLYDVKAWQVHACVMTARNELRNENEVLCSRTGPGGGWFVADTEEEARLFGLTRAGTALTIAENTVADMEAALLGVVRSEPLMEPYWKKTRGRLLSICRELTRVKYELAVASMEVDDLAELETDEEDDNDA